MFVTIEFLFGTILQVFRGEVSFSMARYADPADGSPLNSLSPTNHKLFKKLKYSSCLLFVTEASLMFVTIQFLFATFLLWHGGQKYSPCHEYKILFVMAHVCDSLVSICNLDV